jgi:hypothetical protein
MKSRSRRLALLVSVTAVAIAVPLGLAVGNASAATDPHAGYKQYSDHYKLQNRTHRQAGQVFTITGGVMNFNVHSGEQRVELAWNRWSNQSRAHLWSGDILLDKGSQRTAIMQIKNNKLGEPIYIQVYDANGDLRNDGGGTIAKNMYGRWFHLDADYNPSTGVGHVWINGNLVYTRNGYKKGSGDGWYFKNGAYNNGLPKGGVTSVHFRNITTWSM